MTDMNNLQLNSSSAPTTASLADLSDEDLAKLTDDQKLQLAGSIAKELKVAGPGQEKMDLTKPESAAILTQTVEQLELYYDPPLARDLVRRLSQRLLSESSSISSKLVEAYQDLILRARFICLDILHEEEIQDVLNTSLVKYLAMPAMHSDVVEKLGQSFVRYVWPPDTEPFARKLLISLEKNQELLGSKDLAVSEAASQTSAKPTVANWLKDYWSFQAGLRASAGWAKNSGSNFARISYLNKIASGYGLSKEQKEILDQVLEINDWLRTGWMEDFIKESKPWTESEEIKNIFADLSKNDPAPSQAAEEDISANPAQTPIVPVPQNESNVRPMSEIQLSAKPFEPIKLSPSNLPKPSPLSGGSLNIQDFLKGKKFEAEDDHASGLSLGGGTAGQVVTPKSKGETEIVKPVSTFVKSQTPMQEEIDKKLDELEKRTGDKE